MVSVKLLVQRLPQGEHLMECDVITTIILTLKKRNPGVEPFIKENIELHRSHKGVSTPQFWELTVFQCFPTGSKQNRSSSFACYAKQHLIHRGLTYHLVHRTSQLARPTREGCTFVGGLNSEGQKGKRLTEMNPLESTLAVPQNVKCYHMTQQFHRRYMSKRIENIPANR